MKWALVGAGLLSTSCAGVVGASAAVVMVGAGVLGFTCYDRVSVTDGHEVVRCEGDLPEREIGDGGDVLL